ncbi:MAG: transposase, partial [Saprospiraceae bacterium]|nr:transposase [Saprospiraceae bacterium]
MKKQRRKFSKEFKLQVVLEALKERLTLNDLSQKYELHPNQIS